MTEIVTCGSVRGRRVVEDSADVVIVGSGAAGGVAARVLSEAGIDVVVIEEGPSIATAELRKDVFTGLAHAWRDMGFLTAKGRSFIPILQGRAVGGTTTINAAICHRMPEAIHAGWVRDHGAGELRYEDLARAWDTIERELSISPAPDEVLGENARLMGVGARALGIASEKIRRNVKGCRGSARCLQGCPHEAKQSMALTYIPRALAKGARVYATCEVRRVVAERGRAAGIVGRFRDLEGGDGPALRVRARRAVIVAASAIQTPLLLRASGIGGRSGQVGRRFQAHPGTAVVGVFDRPTRLGFGATQGQDSMHFWSDRLKLESLSLPPELLAARLPGLGDELGRELASYDHLACWAVQIRARAHGTVRRGLFGTTEIRYDPTDEDVRTLKRGVKTLARMMFAAGAREVLPGVHGLPDRISSPDPMERIDALPDDPRLFHCIASHLFGTSVMGSDPARSVVRPDGQSHELTGLYVADSSAFPTNLGVNPQHSIMAFAWLVAERLTGSSR